MLNIFIDNLDITEIQNPDKLKSIFFDFIGQIYEEDISTGVLCEDSFSDFSKFQEALQETTYPKNPKQSTFLNTIANYGISFQLAYAMIASIGQELMEQSGFNSLSLLDKYTMFFSIKRDFLVEARYWSMQFLNDNQDVFSDVSMIWFTEKQGRFPR